LLFWWPSRQPLARSCRRYFQIAAFRDATRKRFIATTISPEFLPTKMASVFAWPANIYRWRCRLIDFSMIGYFCESADRARTRLSAVGCTVMNRFALGFVLGLAGAATMPASSRASSTFRRACPSIPDGPRRNGRGRRFLFTRQLHDGTCQAKGLRDNRIARRMIRLVQPSQCQHKAHRVSCRLPPSLCRQLRLISSEARSRVIQDLVEAKRCAPLTHPEIGPSQPRPSRSANYHGVHCHDETPCVRDRDVATAITTALIDKDCATSTLIGKGQRKQLQK
jgi:hypothetical protein